MRVGCLILIWRTPHSAIFDRASVFYICCKEIGLSEGWIRVGRTRTYKTCDISYQILKRNCPDEGGCTNWMVTAEKRVGLVPTVVFDGLRTLGLKLK
ncbi:hypothetical protein NDU88_008687 [Pleurodeles waltl]|uniref:Uncharacterized protein n=1 Tax=Pleurodeles waltl TaxID=8319 RepID=A0AAV7RW69_PLEWA|nr:hypothetical protein NDU88_008687 [Pleurodeles waltl]